MDWRRVQPLHVVQRDRWIDQEAKDTGADHIPECNADEKT